MKTYSKFYYNFLFVARLLMVLMAGWWAIEGGPMAAEYIAKDQLRTECIEWKHEHIGLNHCKSDAAFEKAVDSKMYSLLAIHAVLLLFVGATLLSPIGGLALVGGMLVGGVVSQVLSKDH